MPQPQTVVLNFQDPSGNPLSGGRADLQLQMDISATMLGGPQVSAGRLISVPLDTTGTGIATVWIEGMTPTALYFVTAFTALGQLVWQGYITVGASYILLEDGTLILLESGSPQAILTEVQP